MEPNDRNVQAPEPEPERSTGAGGGHAFDSGVRRALETAELDEDLIAGVEREVNEGMQSPKGTDARAYAEDLLDWQAAAYSGWKNLDSFFGQLDDRLECGDPDQLKNLAILSGKIAKKRLPPEWSEDKEEYLLLLMILSTYGGPLAKIYLNQTNQHDDE
jgi:hypothetical protein